ncbi:response regulator [Hellea balneolensis]|uniref:response regulator n=1 Tax=Hellea balneolensis TaxID=287478 RepID=UPI00047DA912|nr:response regulator [Hellea balneolensis]
MVDDDSDNILITQLLLRKSGTSADFKGLDSGEALYEYIKHNGIGSMDVILLDINMPMEDGFDVLKKLKAYPDVSDLKIIMYSTSKRPDETRLALELGADNFVEKPRRLEDIDQLSKAIFSEKDHQASVNQFG